MAGHAKFIALYERAFWREAGCSGTAMSQRGPLTEIHDASDELGKHAVSTLLRRKSCLNSVGSLG